MCIGYWVNRPNTYCLCGYSCMDKFEGNGILGISDCMCMYLNDVCTYMIILVLMCMRIEAFQINGSHVMSAFQLLWSRDH